MPLHDDTLATVVDVWLVERCGCPSVELMASLIDRDAPDRRVDLVRTSHGIVDPSAAIDVSVSHTRAWTAIAAVRDARVGVDLEALRCIDHDRVARRWFDEAEGALIAADSDPRMRFFEAWTLKEARAKMLRTGLSTEALRWRPPWRPGAEGVTVGSVEYRIVDALPDAVLAVAVEHDRHRPISLCLRPALSRHPACRDRPRVAAAPSP